MSDDIQFPESVELDPIPVYEGVDVEYRSDVAYGDPGEVVETNEEDTGDTGESLRRLEPYDLTEDSSGNWSCLINEGYFYHSHVRNAGYVNDVPADSAVKLEIPKIYYEGQWRSIAESGFTSTSSGDSFERPRLAIPAATSWIYLKFSTDNHGNVKPPDTSSGSSGSSTPAVTIIASTSELDSIHHIPPDENGDGDDGTSYVQIAKTEPDSAGDPEMVHEGKQGDYLWQEAFVLRNIGANNIYKEFDRDSDTLDLRGIIAPYGLTVGTTTTNVQLDFDGSSIGTGVAVYLETTDPDVVVSSQAEYRSIDQGESGSGQQQINVRKRVSDPTTIEVVGNDKDGTLTFKDCDDNTLFALTWEDGLITNAAGAEIIVGECNETTAP